MHRIQLFRNRAGTGSRGVLGTGTGGTGTGTGTGSSYTGSNANSNKIRLINYYFY